MYMYLHINPLQLKNCHAVNYIVNQFYIICHVHNHNHNFFVINFSFRKLARPTWWDCLRTPICAPSTPSESPSCQRTSNWPGGSVESEHKCWYTTDRQTTDMSYSSSCTFMWTMTIEHLLNPSMECGSCTVHAMLHLLFFGNARLVDRKRNNPLTTWQRRNAATINWMFYVITVPYYCTSLLIYHTFLHLSSLLCSRFHFMFLLPFPFVYIPSGHCIFCNMFLVFESWNS